MSERWKQFSKGMCSLLEAAKAREFVSKAEDIITMENDKEKEKRKRRKQTVG